jgi:hypothetical protein
LHVWIIDELGSGLAGQGKVEEDDVGDADRRWATESPREAIGGARAPAVEVRAGITGLDAHGALYRKLGRQSIILRRRA